MTLSGPEVETVETGLGSVELARAGAGPPVLFIHGTPGGWDSSVSMGRFLVEAASRSSRLLDRGTRGTPLDRRRTIDDQADLHAALLDAIGCERAGVMTWSGGGPSGYRLLRFIVDHAPRRTVSATLKAEGDLSRDELRTLLAQVLEDDRKLDVVRTMARVAGDYRNRRPGVENDWLKFGGIDSLELERIGTPTLVINGSADIDVPPVHQRLRSRDDSRR